MLAALVAAMMERGRRKRDTHRIRFQGKRQEEQEGKGGNPDFLRTGIIDGFVYTGKELAGCRFHPRAGHEEVAVSYLIQC